MKINKILVVLLTLCMFLVACSSNSGNTNQANQAGNAVNDASGQNNASKDDDASGKKVTVNFWHSMGGNNGVFIDEMIAAYNASQDKVEVVGTFQGNYQDALTKIQQAVPAGTAPDLAMLERGFTPLLAEADVLEDFNPWLESTGMSSDYFFEGLLGNTMFDGKFVALPLNRSTPVLHVNKTMIEEIGMEIPTNWDELAEVSNALVIKEGNEIKRYGYSMGYASWYPIAMIVQQGAGFFKDDNSGLGFDKEAEIALTFMKDLQRTGGLYYPPNTDSGNIISQMFSSGQVGMIMESTGLIGRFAGQVDFEYTTAFLPANESFGAPTGGANLVMFNTSQAKEAAWDFANWLYNDEKGAVDFIVKSGYIPVSPSMADAPVMKKAFEETPARQNAFNQLEYTRDTANHASFAEVDQIFLKAIEAIMYDDEDITTTIEKFKSEAENIMKQY